MEDILDFFKTCCTGSRTKDKQKLNAKSYMCNSNKCNIPLIYCNDCRLLDDEEYQYQSINLARAITIKLTQKTLL